MLDSSRRILLYAGLGLLAGVFFLLDWLLPVGTTVELLQVAVILLTLFLPGRAPTVGFGLVTTLLVGLGCVLQFGRAVPADVLMNRGLVLAGLWVAVAVVLRYKQVRQAQRESEAKAQAILETTVDGIITIDAEGTLEISSELGDGTVVTCTLPGTADIATEHDQAQQPALGA
jgi:PAS domain-containing protein